MPETTAARIRKPAGPMTATKAISDITKLRAKASAAQDEILAQLPDSDRKRVIAFLEADVREPTA